MTEAERLTALIYLLEKEIKCLRSVLSEFDGDKSEYLQMKSADTLRDAIQVIQFRKETGGDDG